MRSDPGFAVGGALHAPRTAVSAADRRWSAAASSAAAVSTGARAGGAAARRRAVPSGAGRRARDRGAREGDRQATPGGDRLPGGRRRAPAPGREARAARRLPPGAYVVVVRAPGHAQEDRIERLHGGERLARTYFIPKERLNESRDRRARAAAARRDRRGLAAGRGDPQHPRGRSAIRFGPRCCCRASARSSRGSATR